MGYMLSNMTGEQLDGWRRRRALTIAGMAEELGISERTAYAYLADQPIPYTVARLCSALSEIDRLRTALARSANMQRVQTGQAAKHDQAQSGENVGSRSQISPRGTLVTV